jgi:hypothetical protein
MDLLYDAIKWIFSGIGVAILAAVANKAFKKKDDNKYNSKGDYKTQIGGTSSNNIQAEGNVTINQNNNYISDKYIKNEHEPQKKNPIDKLAYKFLNIYEQHGVNRTQLPSFIDKKFNITFLDVIDEKTILPKITDELISWTCEKFNIKKGYFYFKEEDLFNNRLYDSINCYKFISDFIEIFDKIIEEYGIYKYKNVTDVYFLKTFKQFLGEKTKGYDSDDADVIAIIGINIGNNQTPIVHKYILITSNLRWDYWKSRQFIKKMIRVVDSLNIRIHGYDISREQFDEIASCKVVPRSILENCRQVTWYPEDYNGSNNSIIDKLEYEVNEDFQDALVSIDNAISKLLEEKRDEEIAATNISNK